MSFPSKEPPVLKLENGAYRSEQRNKTVKNAIDVLR